MQPPELLVQRSRPAGFAHGIHERHRRRCDRDRALDVAGQPGCIGEAAQQLDLVDVRRPVFAARPAATAPERGRGGSGRRRRHRRARRRRRPRSSAGSAAASRSGAVPVLGERGPFRGAARVLGRRGVERLGERGVERAALAGQQLAVHRFAGERVAERVPVSLANEHVGIQELMQRGAERLHVHSRGRLQRCVVDPAPGGRHDLQQPPRRIRHARDADQQQRAQRGRQLGSGLPGRARSQQLLGEVRVALRARVDPRDELTVRAAADDALHLQRRVGAGQRVEVEALRALAARQLAHEPEQGRRDGFVRAQRDQQQQPLLAQVAREEAQEILGGAVGPVDVLDDEQDGRLGAETAEEPEQQLEQPRLRVRRGSGLRRAVRARASAAPARRGPARASASPRSAATIGAYGSSPACTGTHSPHSTSRPSEPARPASSRASRVLPTPASPATSTSRGLPCGRPLERRLERREDVVAADHLRARDPARHPPILAPATRTLKYGSEAAADHRP